ncbi:hypothetical protein LJC14_03145 [Treponema sp. OttesenSCG-928-L16]|nr:hypothetical protein [Treponema sp. OttesenSCG-928-L16]
MNSRKLLERLVNNWPAKMLSVALAVILFIFHRMSVLEERFFSVPLKIETNGNLVPSNSYPRMVRVTLRGEANSIYPIVEDDIEAYMDLTAYTEEGFYKAPVQVRKKGTAVGVEPLEINVDPVELSVSLDQKMSKYVPVTPIFRGYLESGYELVSYTMDPVQVEIEGPQGIINSVTELSTDFIELGGRKEDFTTTVHLLSRDPLIVMRGTGTVQFRAYVQELIMVRNFDGQPIAVNGLNSKFRAELESPAGSVRLEGSQIQLADYVPWGNMLTIDCSNIEDEGSYILPVTANIPPPFRLVRHEPMEALVRIYPAESNETAAEDEL